MDTNFKKASDLLHSKKKIILPLKMNWKEDLHAKRSQIYETSKIPKSSILKETYECPSIKTLYQSIYSIICINIYFLF